jgi:hypothetical protein
MAVAALQTVRATNPSSHMATANFDSCIFSVFRLQLCTTWCAVTVGTFWIQDSSILSVVCYGCFTCLHECDMNGA